MPTVGTGLFPSEGECERSAVPAVLTQEAEIDPNPGTGDFRPGRAGAFFATFGGGGVRTLRRAAVELLPGGSRGRAPPGARGKRGYRTPLKTWFRP